LWNLLEGAEEIPSALLFFREQDLMVLVSQKRSDERPPSHEEEIDAIEQPFANWAKASP